MNRDRNRRELHLLAPAGQAMRRNSRDFLCRMRRRPLHVRPLQIQEQRRNTSSSNVQSFMGEVAVPVQSNVSVE